MTVSWRHFVLHYIEMVVAMFVGMMALDPMAAAIFGAFGAEGTWARTDVYALVIGLNMVIGMWVWMWVRGHSVRMNAEMGGAMYAPFVVLVVPYWLGWLGGDLYLAVSNTLMFLTMLGAMWARRAEYSHHHGFRWSARKAPEPAAVTPE